MWVQFVESDPNLFIHGSNLQTDPPIPPASQHKKISRKAQITLEQADRMEQQFSHVWDRAALCPLVGFFFRFFLPQQHKDSQSKKLAQIEGISIPTHLHIVKVGFGSGCWLAVRRRVLNPDRWPTGSRRRWEQSFNLCVSASHFATNKPSYAKRISTWCCCWWIWLRQFSGKSKSDSVAGRGYLSWESWIYVQRSGRKQKNLKFFGKYSAFENEHRRWSIFS